MLTSVQAAHARRFTVSLHGGFSVPAVDELRARLAATLASYEGTGTPGRGGLTADELDRVALPSVIAERGYALLEVQDFLDEAHEALATFEHRAARPAPSTWAAQGAWHPEEPSALPAASTPVPSQHPAPSRPLPRNVTPAIRALAAVGGSPRPDMLPPSPPVVRPPAPAPAPAAAPARAYGMDADALLFELQQVVAQSRARGALQVSVQVPGQQLRVLRVVESAPGTITIVAQ